MMKKILLLVMAVLLMAGGYVSAQETVYSRDASGSSFWSDPVDKPWYRDCDTWWIDRPDRSVCGDGVTVGPNNIFIGHNNNKSMIINGEWFQVQTLTLQAGADEQRTFSGLGAAGLSLYAGITNDANEYHVFNTEIGIDAATVTINANAGNLAFTQPVYLNANDLVFTGSHYTYVDGVVSGTGNLTKQGLGGLSLTGENTYTGTTTHSAGILLLGDNLASSAITVETGAFLYIGFTGAAADVTINALTVNPGGFVSIYEGSSLTINGNLVNNGTFTIESSTAGTGSLITNGTVAGTINVERYFTKFDNTASSAGWNFLSSPITTQAVSGFQTLPGDNDLFKWDEAAGEWDNRKTDAGGVDLGFETNFTVGLGYLVAYDADITKTYIGAIRTTPFTTPALSYAYAGVVVEKGWNLLGNPFTSAIDWDLITRDGSVNDEVQVIKSDGTGYAVWTSGGGGAGDLLDGIIPAGKGFMVQTTASAQTLTIDLNDRVHTTNDYKSSNVAEGTMKVKVLDGDMHTTMFVRFNEEATSEFDGSWDAHKFLSFCSVAQVYTYDDNTLYAVNSLSAESTVHDVNMACKTYHDGEYTFVFSDINQVSDLYRVQFEDKETGVIMDIEEGIQYAFSADEGDNENRFKLHFGATGIEDIKTSNLQAYMSGENLMIIGEEGQAELSIFDIQGKQVFVENIQLTSDYKKSLSLSTGIYIVRVKMNDMIKTNKVIIK